MKDDRLTRNYYVIFCLVALALLGFGCAGNHRTTEETPGARSSGSVASSPQPDTLDSADTDRIVALPADTGQAWDPATQEPSSDIAGWDQETVPIADDSLWLMFAQVEEYYAMGGTANREGSWEEAQYYFEKALKILASLDVPSDSALTPEAVKYNTLLDNIVADYRVALRSLGRLGEDTAPSAIVERFGDLESKLEHDSMVVYNRETGPQSFDLPIVMNDRVRSSVVYFQKVADDAFRRYLGRSRKYRDLFLKELAHHGLPQDLIYLSLVESGYNPHAYSFARAVGLWQFIASTGEMYGLRRTWWVDERKDPVKATRAACRFLKDLYDKFGKWDLAMAAYNGGPGRVERTIKSQKTDDFWKLRLRRQTMDYVPLIYAATIIAKDPAKYGFGDVVYEPPLTWDEVTVDRCVDLRDVATRLGCSVDTLRLLNPELLRVYTPPGTKNYTLKVPSGMKQSFAAIYDQLQSPKDATFAHHKVKKRETIASIASKYGVSQYAILEANNLAKGTKVKAGRELIIPVPADYAQSQPKANTKKKTKSAPGTGDTTGGVYTVREGDTMWDISRALGITVDELRRVNNMERKSRLHIGQKLRIPASAMKAQTGGPAQSSRPDSDKVKPAAPAPKAAPSGVYTVRTGDSIWDIARKTGTTVDQLRRMNGLAEGSRIYAGQTLRLPAKSNGDFVMYQVKNGDTLTRIAQKYRTTIDKIIAWNGLDDPHDLKIGDRIRIGVE